jgi:class 3 adenylate cyclase
MGDGLLATANMLLPHPDPVMAVTRAALRLRAAAAANPARRQIRAGIHIGPVVSGVVGRSKFSFDLWGGTVNVAARLSTLGTDAAVHLSADAWRQVAGRCLGEPLGLVVVKGKGQIELHRCIEVLRHNAVCGWRCRPRGYSGWCRGPDPHLRRIRQHVDPLDEQLDDPRLLGTEARPRPCRRVGP